MIVARERPKTEEFDIEQVIAQYEAEAQELATQKKDSPTQKRRNTIRSRTVKGILESLEKAKPFTKGVVVSHKDKGTGRVIGLGVDSREVVMISVVFENYGWEEISPHEVFLLPEQTCHAVMSAQAVDQLKKEAEACQQQDIYSLEEEETRKEVSSLATSQSGLFSTNLESEISGLPQSTESASLASDLLSPTLPNCLTNSFFPYQYQTAWCGEVLVPTFPWLENVPGLLAIAEVCFLKESDSFGSKLHLHSSLRMLRELLAQIKELPSRKSSKRLGTWGMWAPGNFSTANGTSPKIDPEFSVWAITGVVSSNTPKPYRKPLTEYLEQGLPVNSFTGKEIGESFVLRASYKQGKGNLKHPSVLILDRHPDGDRLYKENAPSLRANLSTGGGTMSVVYKKGNTETVGEENAPCLRSLANTGGHQAGSGAVKVRVREVNGEVYTERSLTAIEYERLMGWTEGATQFGITADGTEIELSETQRKRICGNGIIPYEIADILTGLKSFIELTPLGATEEKSEPLKQALSGGEQDEKIALICGIDEVGKGAYFGPVAAAAVILDPQYEEELRQHGVADSKSFGSGAAAHVKRKQLASLIKSSSVSWAIGIASAQEIDSLGIEEATSLAMRRAAAKLTTSPTEVLIDGSRCIPLLESNSWEWVEQRCIVGGDKTELSISAASILAKAWRDETMLVLSKKYPELELEKNNGYSHDKYLKIGVHRFHRRSWAPVAKALEWHAKPKNSEEAITKCPIKPGDHIVQHPGTLVERRGVVTKDLQPRLIGPDGWQWWSCYPLVQFDSDLDEVIPESVTLIKSNIQLDPELQALIPPLSEEEREGLEANLVAQGCLSPLVTWKGLLVDGHNRKEICDRHSIPYEIKELDFPDKEAVIDWMIDHQLGRRNLSEEMKAYLIGRRYNSIKKKQGGTGANQFTGSNQSDSSSTSASAGKSLAEKYGVSLRTIARNGKYASAVDSVAEIVPEARVQLLQKPKKEVEELAALTEKAPDLVKEVVAGTKPLREVKQAVPTSEEADSIEVGDVVLLRIGPDCPDAVLRSLNGQPAQVLEVKLKSVKVKIWDRIYSVLRHEVVLNKSNKVKVVGYLPKDAYLDLMQVGTSLEKSIDNLRAQNLQSCVQNVTQNFHLLSPEEILKMKQALDQYLLQNEK